jgi:hypothetical protein
MSYFPPLEAELLVPGGVNAGNLPANYTLQLANPSVLLLGGLAQATTITVTGWIVGGQLTILVADPTGGNTLKVVAGNITTSLGSSPPPTLSYGVFTFISPDGINAVLASSNWVTAIG